MKQKTFNWIFGGLLVAVVAYLIWFTMTTKKDLSRVQRQDQETEQMRNRVPWDRFHMKRPAPEPSDGE